LKGTSSHLRITRLKNGIKAQEFTAERAQAQFRDCRLIGKTTFQRLSPLGWTNITLRETFSLIFTQLFNNRALMINVMYIGGTDARNQRSKQLNRITDTERGL
jgi:cystathionine beta-lyase family protein involved in aluminum resistance